MESPSAAEPPTRAQCEAYGAFVARHDNVLPAIERALARYYNKVKPTYCEDRDGDWIDENMPALATASDIWKRLEHVRLDVPPQDGKSLVLGLLANTSWDMEHGIQLVLRNCKVASVGLQGEDH